MYECLSLNFTKLQKQLSLYNYIKMQNIGLDHSLSQLLVAVTMAQSIQMSVKLISLNVMIHIHHLGPFTSSLAPSSLHPILGTHYTLISYNKNYMLIEITVQ